MFVTGRAKCLPFSPGHFVWRQHRGGVEREEQSVKTRRKIFLHPHRWVAWLDGREAGVGCLWTIPQRDVQHDRRGTKKPGELTKNYFIPRLLICYCRYPSTAPQNGWKVTEVFFPSFTSKLFPSDHVYDNPAFVSYFIIQFVVMFASFHVISSYRSLWGHNRLSYSGLTSRSTRLARAYFFGFIFTPTTTTNKNC